jgi:hypothetical protein
MYDIVVEQVVAALEAQPAGDAGPVDPTIAATDATVVYGRTGSTVTVTVSAPGVVPTGEVELRWGDEVLATGVLGDGGDVRLALPALRLHARSPTRSRSTTPATARCCPTRGRPRSWSGGRRSSC